MRRRRVFKDVTIAGCAGVRRERERGEIFARRRVARRRVSVGFAREREGAFKRRVLGDPRATDDKIS